MNKIVKILSPFVLPIVMLAVFSSQACCSVFVPSKSAMSIGEIRPGMKGEALTVIKGREVISFPVEIVSVIPKKGIPRHLIMIKASGPVIEKTGGIASGMSGSPVYINGKLIGAIGYGWDFADHNLGLVTPIEDMASIWKWPERTYTFTNLVKLKEDEGTQGGKNADLQSDGKEISGDDLQEKATPIMADGLSARSLENIGKLLGRRILTGGAGPSELPVEYNANISPGEAIGVLLAWGDVTMGATGTITSVSHDGRFVAFGHPFLNRGDVAYPLTRVWVHGVIPSFQSPFKVGTPTRIIGSVTQDRPQAIGGRIGAFQPSVDVSVKFSDLDMGTEARKRFHVVYDPFMISDILPEMAAGVVDGLWGRKGEGTSKVTIEVEGGGLQKGWSRTDYFFSDKDAVGELGKAVKEITRIVSLNPFQEIVPLGIHVNTEFTSMPRILFIEDLEVEQKEFKPGDEVSVVVKLRPYREAQVVKKYKLRIPKDAVGPCEILVRGGGIAELGQETIAQGYKSISSFSQMLREMSSKEANNEVILELLCDKEPISTVKVRDEDELLSEVKSRRIKEGTMRVFKSNYYVDGLLRKTVFINKAGITNKNEDDVLATTQR